MQKSLNMAFLLRASILVIPFMIASILCFLPQAVEGRPQCHDVVQAVQAVQTTQIVAPAVAVPILVPAISFQYTPALSHVYPTQSTIQAPVATTADVQLLIGTIQNQPSDSGPPVVKDIVQDETVEVPTKPSNKSEIEAKAKLILSNKCASCHSQPNTQGGVTIFNSSGGLALNVGIDALWYVTRNGVMPPNADTRPEKRLKPEEIRVLRDWMLIGEVD